MLPEWSLCRPRRLLTVGSLNVTLRESRQAALSKLNMLDTVPNTQTQLLLWLGAATLTLPPHSPHRPDGSETTSWNCFLNFSFCSLHNVFAELNGGNSSTSGYLNRDETQGQNLSPINETEFDIVKVYRLLYLI